MSSTILRVAAVIALATGLAGCVVYEPAPGYAYAPAVYGPPVYGTVVVGGGGGWHHWH
jgi:hypothetical protein